MLHISSDNSKSILTNVQDGDIQPNATDLRIDKIFKIENDVFESMLADLANIDEYLKSILDDESYYRGDDDIFGVWWK